MKNIIILITIVTLWAKAEVKPVMQDFFNLTSKLQPYIIDKKLYLDPKNEKEISLYLNDFSDNTKLLKKDKMSHSDDMKFRAKLLTEGLDEANNAFKDGFKDYSYWVLKSTLHNCYSCHTQKSLGSTAYSLKEIKSSDLYSKAEFLFIVRNYNESIPLFEKVLAEYPKNKASVENIESAAQKILFFAIRVSRDDRATEEIFKRILKNNEIHSGLRSDILAWKKYLSLRKYRINEERNIESEKDLNEFMSERNVVAEEYKNFNQRAAVDLDTTHFLFQLLEKPKTTNFRASVLYWLASIERNYRMTMFDQTADNYLKECIEKYSGQKIAKKCFELYKEIQTISYTGSRGTDIPKSVKQQLEFYEKLVNK